MLPKFEFDVDHIGQISDGSHTFDELYYHRMMLFFLVCKNYKDKVWKSFKHHDGTMFEDYFIVGITTPEGDFTYHYHKDHWNMFNVRELDFAPEWDGHTSEDITRLLSLTKEEFENPMKKKYEITLDGCHDSNFFDIEINESYKEVLNLLESKSEKESESSCQPRFYFKEIE